MSMHEDLPVYRASYELVIEVLSLVSHFQREQRYLLGDRLKAEALEILLLIQEANMSANRAEVLREACRRTGVIRILVRVAKDMKQISLKRFVALNIRIEEVSRQLTGWQKSSLKQQTK